MTGNDPFIEFAAPPNNLPIQPTPFLGRKREVRSLCQLLLKDEVRLLTLTGPGGTGKTRLGLQMAADLSHLFTDGIYFVNLAPINDPALVMPAIAQILNLKDTEEQPLLDLLKTALRDKRILLLLDNFEQVVSAAVQIADLLTACSKLKVVVTSRVVLHIRAEHEFTVLPLTLPDLTHLPDLAALSQYEAVALFLQRAQGIKPDFQLTAANAYAISEICARLDGLPLAIELAAARIKLLPPQALLKRLSQRLHVLVNGARDAPVRQQTLRNTIEWSYDLLDAQEQRLFRRLAVFVDGCTPEAVEAVSTAVGDKDIDVLEGIALLLDQSLLQQGEQANGEPRLLMLETIREYGLLELASSGEAEATHRASAAYYLRMAEQAEPHLIREGQLRWLERLEREHSNLGETLHWLLENDEREKALRLAAALWQFWLARGYTNEGRQWLERGLEESGKVEVSIRAKALTVAAALALNQCDFARTEVLCGESLLLYQAIEDQRGRAISLYMLGTVAHLRSNYEAAHSIYEESLVLFKQVSDQWGIAWTLSKVADLAFTQGNYTRAYALAEESLTQLKALGDKRSIGYILLQVVNIASYRGEYTRTHALAEESLAIHRELGDKAGIAQALHQWGGVLLNQGDYVRAWSLLQEGLAIYRDIGARRGVAGALFNLGRVALGQRDYVRAQTLLEESLTIFKELDNKWLMALGFEELGAVVALQGQPTWAARCVGVAAALRKAAGSPPEPMERTNYAYGIAHARTQLGDEAFAAAMVEGRMMTPAQVLAAQGQATISAAPASAPPAKRCNSPLELTTREIEVLQLLARGLTNAQIAEQLFVSLLTVKAHLRSIYSKLGITSRSAATRYALEHDLR